MPCDTWTKPRQTMTERKEEVKKVVTRLDQLIANRIVKVKVGPQGAIAFEGWTDGERDRVTDACAYRRIMVSGSALARAEIAKAEQLSGRTVSKTALAGGHHSHDGGKSWHHGH